RAPNITHLFGPSGYKAIFINAVFQSKLYQDSMVMIDTLKLKDAAAVFARLKPFHSSPIESNLV
ncbi:MAG: hypothetical protein LBD04_03685, partial [Synergistaceae bacterium]|nr:hypothetical protein [Synergistaceae bacterium]